MNNTSFWNRINIIIDDGFSPAGLLELEYYAELFITRKCVFKRFSSAEQHGCAAGGTTHVVATVLSCAQTIPDSTSEELPDFKRELKLASKQADIIERWAKKSGCWIDNVDKTLESRLGLRISEGGEAVVYDNGPSLIKTIGLEYFILPCLALDRISLHNALFPETRLSVIGFGRDNTGRFKIVVEQPFVEGSPMDEAEIEEFATKLGFRLIDKRSWTYATSYVYLSDLHDENVIRTPKGNVCVIDCDIRINTPALKSGGIRHWTNEVEFD